MREEESELSLQVSSSRRAERKRMQGQREVWREAKMKGWSEIDT